MSQDRYNVLFLCAANSVRNIFAGAIMNHVGGQLFINPPLKSLGRMSLQSELDQIGCHQGETPP